MVYYYCRHCENELGTLPVELAKEALSFIKKLADRDMEDELVVYKCDGSIQVLAICEQCEKTLEQNPHYHLLEKWLQ